MFGPLGGRGELRAVVRHVAFGFRLPVMAGSGPSACPAACVGRYPRCLQRTKLSCSCLIRRPRQRPRQRPRRLRRPLRQRNQGGAAALGQRPIRHRMISTRRWRRLDRVWPPYHIVEAAAQAGAHHMRAACDPTDFCRTILHLLLTLVRLSSGAPASTPTSAHVIATADVVYLGRARAILSCLENCMATVGSRAARTFP